MLTVSTDNFESHWEHINQTASVAKAGETTTTIFRGEPYRNKSTLSFVVEFHMR